MLLGYSRSRVTAGFALSDFDRTRGGFGTGTGSKLHCSSKNRRPCGRWKLVMVVSSGVALEGNGHGTAVGMGRMYAAYLGPGGYYLVHN